MLASTYACERARVDHFTTCAFKFEYEDMMAFALASVTYVYESALALAGVHLDGLARRVGACDDEFGTSRFRSGDDSSLM